LEKETVNTPESSNIASYAYDHERGVFTVEYKNKTNAIVATWEYAAPPKVFDGANDVLAIGGSIGKYIRSCVINHFEGKKIS
jgi:hypothetical protein